MANHNKKAPSLDNTPFHSHLCLLGAGSSTRFIDHVKTRLENYEVKVTSEKSDSRIVKSQYNLFLLTKELLDEQNTTILAKLASEKAKAHSTEHVIVAKCMSTEDSRQYEEKLKEFYKKLPTAYHTQWHCKPVTDQNMDDSVSKFVDRIRTHCCKTKPKPEIPLNMGANMAVNHYHGYLKHMIPCLKERILSYPAPDDLIMCSKYIQVILTSECSTVPASVTNKFGPNISTAPSEHFGVDVCRGGTKKKFDPPLWTVTSGNKKFCCVAEFPRILVTLDDLEKEGEIRKGRKKWEIIQFYYYLDELIRADSKCRGEVIFVYFDEDEKNNTELADALVEIIRRNPADTKSSDSGKKGVPSEDPSPSPRALSPFPNGKGRGTRRPTSLHVRDADTLHPPSHPAKGGTDQTPEGALIARSPSFVRRGDESSVRRGERPKSSVPVQETDSELPSCTYSSEGERKVLHLNAILDIDWKANAEMKKIFSALDLNELETETKTKTIMTTSEMEICVHKLFNNGKPLHGTALFVCVVTMYANSSGELCDSEGTVFHQSQLTEVLARSEPLRNVPLVFIIDAGSIPPRDDTGAVGSALTTHGSTEDVGAVGVSDLSLPSGFEYDGMTVYTCPPGSKAHTGPLWEKLLQEIERGNSLEQVLKTVAPPERDPEDRFSPYSVGSLHRSFPLREVTPDSDCVQ